MNVYTPPLYPGGVDPYADGPDAGPAQKWAMPGAPTTFRWVRGLGCIAAIPGVNFNDHDWTNKSKFVQIPDAVCAAYSNSTRRSMPAYIDTSGKVVPYRNQSLPGTSPQDVYAYSVPVASNSRWACNSSALKCTQTIAPNSSMGFATKALCDAACTKWRCDGKACVSDKTGPFLSLSACQSSKCGMWGCVPGQFGKCAQQATGGKYSTQAACESAVDCAGYACNFSSTPVQCTQTAGFTKTMAECKAAGCGKWGCTANPGVCEQTTKGIFNTEAECEAPTSVCRNTTNDSQCKTLAGGQCDVYNSAHNKRTCAMYKKRCYSTTAPQCTKDTDCHTQHSSDGPFSSDTGGAYWCEFVDKPGGSGDFDMACANPAFQCTADSDCACSTIPITGVCYTPCKNKKFDKSPGGAQAASAKCEWQGVWGSPQCKCSRKPPH